ncbi:MAG TPA: efflux RND transporter periplasmic adaptor subunit [Verrucomicrobiae bacterium]
MRSLRSIFGFVWTKARQKPKTAGIVTATVMVLLFMIVRSGSKEETTATLYHTVKRGDFLISVVEGGSIKAVNEVVVRSELEGNAPILSIVKEGTYVKKGDLLVELDSADLKDRLTQQEITTESAQFAYVQSKEALTIQKSLGDSAVKDAELALELAKDTLEKYKEGDMLQLERNAENTITLAKEDLSRAAEKLVWTERLAAKDFASQSEVQADNLAKKRIEITLATAETALQLMKKYDFPKQLRLLQSNVDRAEVELMRIKQRTRSQEAQAEVELEAKQRTLDFNEKKLQHLKQQLEFTRISAPQDGMVIYASSTGGNRGNYLIEEGATIRQKQDIIVLPDVSQMMLEVRVHESHVAQIKPGQRAYVTIDSLPDRRFKASIRKVAILPDSNSRYYNPNLKVYPTEIVVEEQLPDLKPGVSGRAEIVVTNLPSVLTVPIQAVTTSRGQQVCYVQNGKSTDRIPVEVGMYNDKFIEIKKGLKDGDTVLLAALANTEIDLGGSIVQADEVDTNETSVAKQIREGTFNDGGSGKSSLDAGGERKSQNGERKSSGERKSGSGERKSGSGGERSSEGSGGERPSKSSSKSNGGT